MTGLINAGTVQEKRFTAEDYIEVERMAVHIRALKKQLTPIQKELLAGCNEDSEEYYFITWDEPDEDKHYDLWDRLDAKLTHGW